MHPCFKLTPIAAALLVALPAALSGKIIYAEEPTVTVKPAATTKSDTAATTAPDETSPEIQLEKVIVKGNQDATATFQEESATTATKTDTLLLDIPQAITVVPQELITSQGALTLRDALRNVSGLTINAGEGRPTDVVTLRGFRTASDTFIDGVRDDGNYIRDLSNVERIDVLKGPSSVLYGRGSTGGIINIISKKPVSDPFLTATLTGGSYDLYRGEIDTGGPLDNEALSYRFSTAYQDSESFRDFYHLERFNVAPALAWKASEDTRFLVQFEHQDDESLSDYGIPAFNGGPADVPIETFYGFPEDNFLKNDVNTATFSVNHKLSSQWTVRNVLKYSDYNQETNNTRLGAVTVDPVTGIANLARTHNAGESEQNNLFNQTDFIHKTNWRGRDHTVLFGLEIGNQALDTRNAATSAATAAIPVAVFDPVITPRNPNGGPDINNPTSMREVDARVIGLYAQDQITLSPHWKGLAGLRYDYYDIDVNNILATTSAGLLDAERTDEEISPRLGLIYQPTETSSLYASYSQSFQPSGEVLNVAQNVVNLEPEQTINYEIGGKMELLDGKLSAGVALFRLEKTNQRTAVSESNQTELALAGEQRTDGVEFDLAGAITPQWNVYAGMAYLDGEIIDSNTVTDGQALEGNRSANTPRFSGNLWNTYEFSNGFGVGGGLSYVGERFVADNNLNTLDSYVRADATAFYRAKGYEIQLNINNVLDKQYYESGSGTSIYPGAPINTQLRLRVNF